MQKRKVNSRLSNCTQRLAFAAVISRLERILGSLEGEFGAGPATDAPETSDAADHPSIPDYDLVPSSIFVYLTAQILSGPVAKLVAAAATIGGDAVEISSLLHTALAAQREVIAAVPLTQRPGDKVYEQLLDGISEAVKAIAVCNAVRCSSFCK